MEVNRSRAAAVHDGATTAQGTAQQPWRPDLSQVRLEDLPAAYAEVAQEIGLPAALTLIEVRGGSRMTVPVAPGKDHPLTRAVDMEAAQRLAAFCGGTCLHIPHIQAACKRARDRAIRAARDSGASLAELAHRFGLAERRVQQIIAGGRE